MRSGFTVAGQAGIAIGWWDFCGFGFLELRNFFAIAAASNDNNANMAGPSDKARFYLEQSATELNELERKKIFTRVGFFYLRIHEAFANNL